MKSAGLNRRFISVTRLIYIDEDRSYAGISSVAETKEDKEAFMMFLIFLYAAPSYVHAFRS